MRNRIIKKQLHVFSPNRVHPQTFMPEHYDEQVDEYFKPVYTSSKYSIKSQRRKESCWSMFKIIQRDVLEFLDQATDMFLLWIIYNSSIEHDLERSGGQKTQPNPDSAYSDFNSFSYKFAFVVIFMSISSQFLIAYSSQLNSLWLRGIYEPDKLVQQGCFIWI